MTKISTTFLIALLALSSIGLAQQKPPSKLTADFTMTRTLVVLEDSIRSSGKLIIGGNGLLRWETTSPTKSVLVVNGQKAWIYYREFDVVKDFELGADPVMKVLSSHLLALTSGDFEKISRLYSIEEKEDGLKKLIPLEQQVKKMFKEMRVSIDSDGVAKRVEMVSASGDLTSIAFENVRINPDLSPSLFTNPKQKK